MIREKNCITTSLITLSFLTYHQTHQPAVSCHIILNNPSWWAKQCLTYMHTSTYTQIFKHWKMLTGMGSITQRSKHSHVITYKLCAHLQAKQQWKFKWFNFKCQFNLEKCFVVLCRVDQISNIPRKQKISWLTPVYVEMTATSCGIWCAGMEQKLLRFLTGNAYCQIRRLSLLSSLSPCTSHRYIAHQLACCLFEAAVHHFCWIIHILWRRGAERDSP